MSDLASFDFDLLRDRIWGRARCLFSGSYNIQWHHIMGRGNAKDPADRRMHSSPFNAAPIIEAIHQYAPMSDLEDFFLRQADRRVRYAVARGDYELTEIDLAFRRRYPLR